jgi:subtilisin
MANQPRRATMASTQNGDNAAQINPRDRQYIIAPRPTIGGLGGFSPLAATENLSQMLNDLPGVTVLKTSRPRSPLGLLGWGANQTPGAIVASMDPETGANLRREAPPHLIVEPNNFLSYSPMRPLFEAGSTQLSQQIDVEIGAVDNLGKPLENATVTVFGLGFPSDGRTDQGGKVRLAVHAESTDSIYAVRVNPAQGNWDKFINRPQLVTNRTNGVTVRPLGDASIGPAYQGFPQQKLTGWGLRTMGLDQIDPTTYDGKGVKIGIIDSGADADHHPLLGHITNGVDLTNNNNTNTWKIDSISHGTHVAGIIASSNVVPGGIRGIVPGAEVHIFKVFPGGRFSDLADALDLCIERKIDLVNLSLGSESASEYVTLKIEEARRNGVVCIVATGNSGGAVQFPATLPSVLAVGAIGRDGEFPGDSYHARQRGTAAQIDNLFFARFSCFGERVNVCGPGVAIISSIPGGGYAAWDGTSMATPHITGLAALHLAHNPIFHQGPFNQRSEQRVDALFEVLRSTCLALPGLSPLQVGWGLPRAIGLSAMVGLPPGPPPAPNVPTIDQPAIVNAVVNALLALGSTPPLNQPPVDQSGIVNAVVNALLASRR